LVNYGVLALGAKKIMHEIIMRFKIFAAMRIKITFFCAVMPWNCQDITPNKVISVSNYEVVSVKLMYHPTYVCLYSTVV
jgi:hypothetical protein